MNQFTRIGILALCALLLTSCGKQEEITSTVEKVPETVMQTETETETETEPETEPETETETEMETEPKTEPTTQPETETQPPTQPPTQPETQSHAFPSTPGATPSSPGSPGYIPEERMNDTFRFGQMNVALELMQKQMETDGQKNILISPFSISAILALTANGANSTTLEQMEAFFSEDIPTLNEDLQQYIAILESKNESRLISANSIWLKDDPMFEVKPDFLDIANNIYHAEVFSEPFTSDTTEKINSWVNEHTEQMIPSILDSIDESAVTYLINALAFESQWSETYTDKQIEDDIFTAYDGSERTVPMMTNTESRYFEDDYVTGFKKYYRGIYDFVALLPNEGVDMQEYLNMLDAEYLLNLLDNPQRADVIATIPKFSNDYSCNLSETLKTLGMEDAFSDWADFSNMTDAVVKISTVLHKTHIEVDQNGTKAAAATAVEMSLVTATLDEPEPPKYVRLDRPFIYMITDSYSNLPLFIGTVNDITN